MLRPSATLLLVACVLAPTPARAQSEADKTTARELGQDGQDALDRSDWRKAEELFRRAETLYHAATLTVGLARAEAHLGKVVEASEHYERVIAENVTRSAALARALEDAKTELPAVQARRARLTVNVTWGSSATPSNLRVTLNDVPQKADTLGAPRFVNPGHIVVVASADGFAPETRGVDVTAGKDETLSIALDPAGSGSVMRSVGIGALAVGGAGLIMGAITGGLVLAKHGTLAGECASGCATPTAQSDLSTYHTLGTLSDIGFIGGAVLAGGGLTLILLAPKSTSSQSASIRPYIGPGALGAVGTF
jgi:hypothetical protein